MIIFSSCGKYRVNLDYNDSSQDKSIYKVNLLPGKLCNMQRVYCLHDSLDEPEFEMKNTNFVD